MTAEAATTYMIDIDRIQSYAALREILELEEGPISSEILVNEEPTFWTWLFPTTEHVHEEQRVVARVKELAKDFVKSKFLKPEEHELIERKWEIILDQACANIGESSADQTLFLAAGKVHTLFDELDQTVVDISTKGVLPFGTDEAVDQEDIRNCLKHLMHGLPLDEFFTWTLAANLPSCGSDQQIEEIVHEIQVALKNICEHLQRGEIADTPIVRACIGHLICYLGFFCTENINTLKIPCLIDGNWRMVNCKVTRITLNPDFLGEIIDALALEPTDCDEASPQLIFKNSRRGTLCGALSWFSDFTPFCSVGEFLFWLGKDRLAAWYNDIRQRFPNAIIEIWGASLGEALAVHMASHHPDHTRIHGFASPGVFSRNLAMSDGKEISGEILFDPDDFVSLTGFFPESVKMFKVIRGEAASFPAHHIRCYGGDETLLLRVNVIWENQRLLRRIMTILHQVGSLPLLFYLIPMMVLQGLYYQITKLFHAVVPTTPEVAME